MHLKMHLKNAFKKMRSQGIALKKVSKMIHRAVGKLLILYYCNIEGSQKLTLDK
jgi:hypothetical protein